MCSDFTLYLYANKKKRKIDISTHLQTIVDDPQQVICLTCSSKLSTYSLKSLKKHLSTQKHLKMLGNGNENEEKKRRSYLSVIHVIQLLKMWIV